MLFECCCAVFCFVRFFSVQTSAVPRWYPPGPLSSQSDRLGSTVPQTGQVFDVGADFTLSNAQLVDLLQIQPDLKATETRRAAVTRAALTPT